MVRLNVHVGVVHSCCTTTTTVSPGVVGVAQRGVQGGVWNDFKQQCHVIGGGGGDALGKGIVAHVPHRPTVQSLAVISLGQCSLHSRDLGTADADGAVATANQVQGTRHRTWGNFNQAEHGHERRRLRIHHRNRNRSSGTRSSYSFPSP